MERLLYGINGELSEVIFTQHISGISFSIERERGHCNRATIEEAVIT